MTLVLQLGLIASLLSAAESGGKLPEALLSPASAVRQAAIQKLNRLPSNEYEALRGDTERQADPQSLRSLKLEKLRDQLRAEKTTGAIAKALAVEMLGGSGRSAEISRLLLLWLGSDASEAAAAFVGQVKPGCRKDIFDVLWAIAPSDPDYRLALGREFIHATDDQQEFAMARIRELWHSRGQSPELEETLRLFMNSGNAQSSMSARRLLGPKAKGESTLIKDAASKTPGERRSALIELLERYKPARGLRKKICKTIEKDRKDWQGSYAPPPLTEDEWGNILEKNPEALDVFLSDAETLNRGSEAFVVFYQAHAAWHAEPLRGRAREFFEARWRVLSEADQQRWLDLHVAFGHDNKKIRQEIHLKLLSHGGEELGGMLYQIVRGLKEDGVDACGDPYWRSEIDNAISRIPGADIDCPELFQDKPNEAS